MHQNICFLKLRLSFISVSHFNICQCNRKKIMFHFICICLKLNMISSFLNYLLEFYFFSIKMFNNISQSETALSINYEYISACSSFTTFIFLSFTVYSNYMIWTFFLDGCREGNCSLQEQHEQLNNKLSNNWPQVPGTWTKTSRFIDFCTYFKLRSNQTKINKCINN